MLQAVQKATIKPCSF